ncbi:hypothetical protein AVEN_77429-1 [Araneus ventricosus]|uniref:Uncharacterized protein n=1 Tax=Araneus ventricosus TaxID=182803 RepID=A0A4Y2MCK8_ARAVE|nr:hypothetical protein AVEN_259082-1 [Araneus ventricosus]GBN24289.1 hypothetical protein AVEN_194137-1 [Araneus ventricosus]GBN24344.1 hypothetical protein AVEN_75912-1 [Araneus ventricosus]GBN24349.1 hypothetical protein AVEN_77429-1 [Araneus ventricosus]
MNHVPAVLAVEFGVEVIRQQHIYSNAFTHIGIRTSAGLANTCIEPSLTGKWQPSPINHASSRNELMVKIVCGVNATMLWSQNANKAL